jgi:hypothetical protein
MKDAGRCKSHDRKETQQHVCLLPGPLKYHEAPEQKPIWRVSGG